MATYSNQEYFNMCLGRCRLNYAEARRVYEEEYASPNRPIPSERCFARLHMRMYNTGSVHRQATLDASRPTRHDDDLEDVVLDIFSSNPTRSTRASAQELGVNHVRVWRILNSHGQHPYHYQRVQSLTPSDYRSRVTFCRWLLNKFEENANFLKLILFTDECSFARTGVFNCHNEHVWSVNNPRAIKQSHFQHRWKINVWAGIIGDQIFGPHFLDNTMNGANYLHFLREVVEDNLDCLDLQLRRTMWFQHDGAPPHFLRDVRAHLNHEFGQRWIGRGGPVIWPARSPDLTMMDFFLWGRIKESVYVTECDSEVEMRQRIISAFQSVKADVTVMSQVRDNMLRRVRTCIAVEGRHFEHVLSGNNNVVDVIVN